MREESASDVSFPERQVEKCLRHEAAGGEFARAMVAIPAEAYPGEELMPVVFYYIRVAAEADARAWSSPCWFNLEK